MMTEPFVRPDARTFLDFLNGMPGPKMHEIGAAAARQVYLAMRDMTDLPVGELGARLNVTIPGPAGDIPATLFDPRASREPGPAVVFYHGGGYVIGDVESHAAICAEIARTLDLPVISVDYRLAPEAPWPAAPDDCEAAARWVGTSPAELGRTFTSLVLCGDSAGGNLTIVTAMALRDAPAKVPVIAQLPFYPATDSTVEYPSYVDFAEGYLLTKDSMDWFTECYAPDIAHIRASPLLGNHAGLPPAVVVTASLDPIRDQGRAYAAALIKAGVPVIFREALGNIHGFINIRKAIPSSVGDVAAALAALKGLIVEAEGEQVMAQAAE
jgi:acetyl esterase